MIPAANCEVKLHSFRRTQDGTVVSFLIHPAETPQALALDPLGTRYMLAFAAIGDNEQPVTPPGIADIGRLPVGSPVVQESGENRDAPIRERNSAAERAAHNGQVAGSNPAAPTKTEGQRAVIRAVMLCRDDRFQEWLQDCFPVGIHVGEEKAADWLRNRLNIKSRRELEHNARARHEFEAIEDLYREMTGQRAEMRG